MFELIRDHQLNIMLLLCGACGVLAFLLFITRFISKRRKWILIGMELVAAFLLWFDRLAYIYAGDTSHTAYVMVRVSNCMVFLLTPAVVFGFNLYLHDYLMVEGKMTVLPRRLMAVGIASIISMVMAFFSAITGLYYYFDETNTYHRGDGFLISYIIPVICPIIQYTVVRQYKQVFSKIIYISMCLYLLVPIACGIAQVFLYGISLVNASIVLVSICLYIFQYIDINNEVMRVHKIELENMEIEKKRMQRLFDQTAKAFVSAVEKKDDFSKGNAVKIAEYARKLAKLSGRNEEDCEKAYYTALLHDVGMIGIPDAVIKNEADPDKYDKEAIQKKPVIGKEILSNITEYPYLSLGAAYSHERYNGTGYPEGLKGDEIPEIARLVGCADAYVTMTTPKRYREAKPDFIAREAFIKGAGEEFDPVYANLMVKIIDDEGREKIHDDISIVEKEIECGEYRQETSLGIPVSNYVTNITFNCELSKDSPGGFSGPGIILFDSFDRRVYRNKRAIKSYQYQEFAEIWFDNHSIITSARKIEESFLKKPDIDNTGSGRYEISAVRFEDHVKLTMRSPNFAKEAVIALQDGSTSAYISITGEYCSITDIMIEKTDIESCVGFIPRICEEISYIDHMVSDIPNIQINQTRMSSTEGIEIKNRLKLEFHTMSLPIADFVWHCPYIVIFTSDNGRVNGRNYREYALIKLNGEIDDKYEFAENNFIMKRKDNFPGWEEWKERNKAGFECEVSLEKKGNNIITRTENLGVHIENTTTIKDNPEKVYVALTGDRCALTDIRIR